MEKPCKCEAVRHWIEVQARQAPTAHSNLYGKGYMGAVRSLEHVMYEGEDTEAYALANPSGPRAPTVAAPMAGW